MQKTTVFKNRENVTVNNAGGAAYTVEDKNLLAKLVCTSFFGDTFYTEAADQLDKVKELAYKVDVKFLASCAIYARVIANMKDTPAVLLAAVRDRDKSAYRQIFNKVVTDARILRGLVSVIKSGKFGSKNLVNADRKLIDAWLMALTPIQVWRQSLGNNPSLADVMMLAHPSAHKDPERDAVYALIVKGTATPGLPQIIKDFLRFKLLRQENSLETLEVPKVDFQRLTDIDLTESDWQQIASNMSWTQLRQNLNTLERHNVFKNNELANALANKLSDADLVKKSKVFPYQIYTSLLNVTDRKMVNALQKALDVSVDNVPVLPEHTIVAIDVSGSMGAPVNGANVNGGVNCAQVAGLMAVSILKKNSNSRVLTFDTKAKDYTNMLNPSDSVMTNMERIKFNGGGTSCSSSLHYANSLNTPCDLFIMISDNESWADYRGASKREWDILKKKNPKAKLVMIDLAQGTTTQVPTSKDVLYLGGFHSNMLSVIKNFCENTTEDFVSEVLNKTNALT